MKDVTCNQVNAIAINELPPRFVPYDEPTTPIKSYTQCSEKVSKCLASNVPSLTMKDYIE